jgi:transposase-like protein
MTHREFFTQYPDNEAAKQFFIQVRIQSGVVCRDCSHAGHYYLKTIDMFKCKSCGSRTTLRSGTILHASKLSYLDWITAIYFMCSTKKSMSAKEMQRQLGRKRYEPVWFMMQKIRIMMGKQSSQQKLSGEIEADEAFFEIANSSISKGYLYKGRGSQRQAKVLVLAETYEGKNKPGRPSRGCKSFKMQVLEDLKGDTISHEVSRSVEANSVLLTDGFKAYERVKKVVKEVRSVVTPAKEASSLLPWAHVAISNAKRNLLSAHHRINKEYMQNYLNEYCFRLNNRYSADKLLMIFTTFAITSPWFK